MSLIKSSSRINPAWEGYRFSRISAVTNRTERPNRCPWLSVDNVISTPATGVGHWSRFWVFNILVNPRRVTTEGPHRHRRDPTPQSELWCLAIITPSLMGDLGRIPSVSEVYIKEAPMTASIFALPNLANPVSGRPLHCINYFLPGAKGSLQVPLNVRCYLSFLWY